VQNFVVELPGDSTVSNLGKKRLEAFWALNSYAIGGSTASAAPTSCAELPKQVILTASDLFMYTTIWKIYFEEYLSHKELLDMLKELGLVTVTAAGTAYVVARGSTAIVSEICDWVGPVGWWTSAAITGSLTGLFGAGWILYCDRLYTQREPQLWEF
jgi:hypothetical protein